MASIEIGGVETTAEGWAGSRDGGPPDYRALLYVGVMILLGSTTAAAARYIVRELPTVWVPVVRFGIAGIMILPLAGGRLVLSRLVRCDGPLLLTAALLSVPINQGFFLNAARLGPTSHVGLFYATSPLVVLILAWLMRLERPNVGRLWGVLASVTGVVVIGVGTIWQGGAPPAEARSIMLADLLLIGAVLSWGGYLTVSKPLIMRHGSMPALASTFLAGALLDLPLALIASPTIPHLAHVTSAAWIALAVLTLVITPVNLACQNLAMRRLDASQVANFSNVSPILTVVWGALLFGESITASLVVGGLLTLAGVFWTGTSRPRSARSRRTEGRRPHDRPSATSVPRPSPSVTAVG